MPLEAESEAGSDNSGTDEDESGDESVGSCKESSGGGAPATSPTVREVFDSEEVVHTPVAAKSPTPPKPPSTEGVTSSPLTVADGASTPAKKDTDTQLKTPSGSGRKKEGSSGGSKKKGSGRKGSKVIKSSAIERMVL